MVERIPSRHQVVRVRPITFAYTRPLTPADMSGMTGRLTTMTAPKRKVSPLQMALVKVKGFFKA